jgi:uncharacterized membrane protein YphA (DoxX/SURF4 family)
MAMVCRRGDDRGNGIGNRSRAAPAHPGPTSHHDRGPARAPAPVTGRPSIPPTPPGNDTRIKELTMAITTPQDRFEHAGSAHGGDVVAVRADWRDPRYQAFSLLRLAFTVAPIAFGLDKFFNVLVDWPTYLAPWINDIAPGSGQDFMYVVGAVEILAGIVVALKPRYGAYVVAGWLAGIVLNLLTYSGFYDVALRDFGLMLAALTLARLASIYDPPLRLGRH